MIAGAQRQPRGIAPRRLAVVAVLSAAMTACGKAPPPAAPPPAPPPLTIAAAPEDKVTAPLTITAAADVNPDANGRPSPIVVRVYQLRTDAAFSAADFFALFDDDQATLGPELISRDEFVLAPAEQRVVNAVISGETRYVAAIAAFRDIRNAQWRGLVQTPRSGVSISVERARIVVTAAGS